MRAERDGTRRDDHIAFLKAGVEAQLVVFDGLPHAYGYNYKVKEALDLMAKFFSPKLGRRAFGRWARARFQTCDRWCRAWQRRRPISNS